MYLEAQADEYVCEYVYEYVHVPNIPYLTYISIHKVHTNPLYEYISFSLFLGLYIPYIYIQVPSYLVHIISLSFAFRKGGVRDSRTTRLEIRYVSDYQYNIYLVDFGSKVGTYRYLTYLTLVLPAGSLRVG